jgi:hypothetical protein
MITSIDRFPIKMHHAEATGTLPAWVWRAIATTRRDAGNSMPITVLREGKASKPFDIWTPPNCLVVVDLQDWHRLLDCLDAAERTRRQRPA